MAHVGLKEHLAAFMAAKDRCIAFMGPECGACIGVCPEATPGIALQAWKPVVDAQACVGCGKCIHVCPTSPPALEMVPLSG